MAHPDVFLPAEPESRRAFREVVAESVGRPAAVRFRHAVEVYRTGRRTSHEVPRFPLRPEYLRYLPASDRSGVPLEWESVTAFGQGPGGAGRPLPRGTRTWAWRSSSPDPTHRSPSMFATAVAESAGPTRTSTRDWNSAWDERQVVRLLEWRYGQGRRVRVSPRASEANVPEGPVDFGPCCATDNPSSLSGPTGSPDRRSAAGFAFMRRSRRPGAGCGPRGCGPVRARGPEPLLDFCGGGRPRPRPGRLRASCGRERRAPLGRPVGARPERNGPPPTGRRRCASPPTPVPGWSPKSERHGRRSTLGPPLDRPSLIPPRLARDRVPPPIR